MKTITLRDKELELVQIAIDNAITEKTTVADNLTTLTESSVVYGASAETSDTETQLRQEINILRSIL
jgi:hypothetical protein